MGKKIKSVYGRTKEAIMHFKDDLINNLGFLIPIAMCLIVFISGVVTYIMFIANGGYAAQVAIIDENGLIDGVEKAFTTGTVGLILSGIVGKIIIGSIIVEFIILLVDYFKTSGKAKTIIMVIDLVLLMIQISFTAIIIRNVIDKINISWEEAYEYLSTLNNLTINHKAIFVTYVVLCLISLVTFIVLILITKECRSMVGCTFSSLIFATVVVPLVFLLIENILPIVSIIVVMVICIVVYKIVKFFLIGPGAIARKKIQLETAQQRSSEYKASAEANFKSARDGLNLFVSAETKRKWAGEDLEKASEEDKYARKLQEDIDMLEDLVKKKD